MVYLILTVIQGRFVANDELFIFTAYFISLFDVKPGAVDEATGKKLTPADSSGAGLVG
jgi:hypothetical protein